MKIILKPLKSMRQLTDLSQCKSIEGTGNYYTFKCQTQSGQFRDVTIDFNARLPKLLISDSYCDSEVE